MRLFFGKAALIAAIILAAISGTAAVQAATTTTNPGINVVMPAGGETWEKGQNLPIIWNYSVNPGPSVRILLMQSGSAVRTIAAGVPAYTPGLPQGIYSWTIPGDVPDGSYQIKVESLANSAIYGVSRAVTIKYVPPYIRFDTPKAGSTLTAGAYVPVAWSYHGYKWQQMTIFLQRRSTNQRWVVASRIPIGSNDKGSLNWLVPADAPTAGDYYLTFNLEAVNGWIPYGDTGNLTIQNAKADFLQLTSPANEPQWRAGEAHTITWKYTPYLNFKVNIGYQSDSGNTAIANALPVGNNGSGSYSWTIPENLAPGKYTLWIVATGGPNLKDSQKFTVTVPEYIRIFSPKANYLFELGGQLGVVWMYSGEPGPNVNVVLQEWNTGAARTIGQNVPIANKTFRWTIPDNTAPGLYRLTVLSPAKSSYQSTSEVFKIVKPSTVDLIAPEAGSGWRYGATCKIAWMQHLNTPNATVDIALKKAGKFVRSIASGVKLSQGQQHSAYDWKVPADLAEGSDYAIFISLKDGNFTHEDTGPLFGIGPPPPPRIVLPHH